MNKETVVMMRRALGKLESFLNKNTLGHGEHVCAICDACGHGDIEHTENCPVGNLWEIANNPGSAR